ncbi:MAG: dehydrogenase subunit [Crocinitomicaceae bacterium]|jgi:NADH-quinone oxidoreductase subunit L|nr:dehydrogenase subunit [Crocinitomicaceae bacterium]
MTIETIILTILALPLAGALINGVFGKMLPKSIVGSLATLVMFGAFALAVTGFFHLHEAKTVHLYSFLNFEDFKLNFSLQIDALSIWMTLIITGVGSLIHLFSMGYMHDDKGYYKFFTYLNMFVFAMLILVLGSNYFMLFFGWEGVGICSYLLIGFHYSDEQKGLLNSVAARKAFIMNRVGDLGLLIGLFLLLAQFGTLEYSELADKILVQKINPSTWMMFGITLCLFIGAMGKSAQIPLFTWLPDAMAGPTPVSALIHAATMVTAGIFLVVRSNFLFELAPMTQDIMLYVGLATSLVSAFIAMRQNDIKKVLAYSTVSQLGFIFVSLGMGGYVAAMFHVTTHAFFKALLFLGSGSVIHAMHHEQDIRQMGGLRKYIPITHITFLIGTLAIAGFPFLSGFFSKDEILAHALHHNPVIYALLAFSALLTAIYMFRLYFVVFFGSFRGTEEQRHHLHESPLNMTLPLIVLAVLSVIGGALNIPALFGEKIAHWMGHFLEHTTAGLANVEAIHLPDSQTMMLMITASVVTLAALVISYIFYVKKSSIPVSDSQQSGLAKLSANKLYFDEIYNVLFVKPTEWLSRFAYNFVEITLLNRIVYGFASLVGKSGEIVRKWQSGVVSSYILWMVFGIVGLIVYYFIYQLK